MRHPTRTHLIHCLVLLVIAFCAGCRGSSSVSEKRIILITNGNSAFWDAARAGLQDAEKQLDLKRAGFVAEFNINDATPQGQLDKLRQIAGQSDVAAVAISAIDGNNAAIAEQLRGLQKKGIHVVTVDSDVDRDKYRDARFAFIGTDNVAAGKELGKCARHLRPEGGEYVFFVGRTGAQNAIERMDGVATGAGDKFKRLDTMPDETDRSRAKENVRNAFANHKGLNLLVGIWSYHADSIADVVAEKDNKKDMVVLAFDAEPNAVQRMSTGTIDALLVQNPYQMGFQSIRLLKALAENDQKTVKEMLPDHGKPGGDLYDTGLKVIVFDENSPLKPEIFDKKTEFLKLSDFRKWLAKYNLQGS